MELMGTYGILCSRVELIQGCVVFLWLFNVFFDRVIRQVNKMAMGMGMEGVGKLNKYYMQLTQFW